MVKGRLILYWGYYPYLPAKPPKPRSVILVMAFEGLAAAMNAMNGAFLLAIYTRVAPAALASFGIVLSTAYSFFILPLAVASLIFTVIWIVLVVGVWKGRWWTWILIVVTAITGLMAASVNLAFGGFNIPAILPLIFYIPILVYIHRKSFEAYFGGNMLFPKSVVSTALPFYVNPVQSTVAQNAFPIENPYLMLQLSSQHALWSASCPRCWNTVPNSNFCDHCGTRLR